MSLKYISKLLPWENPKQTLLGWGHDQTGKYFVANTRTGILDALPNVDGPRSKRLLSVAVAVIFVGVKRV